MPDLEHGRKAATGWQQETVAVVGTGAGGHNDLALDASDKAHIVYHDKDQGRLGYAVQK